MRSWIICFFINLFVCIYAKAQQVTAASVFTKQETVNDTIKRVNCLLPAKINTNLNLFSGTAVKRVPANYYYNSLGFFCQKELQIEKTLKVPLKFRLGSVAYTDHMEGKDKKSF